MTRRRTHFLGLTIILCAALVSTMTISSSVFASSRATDCTADLCGGYGGGGGTHYPGGSGRGKYGGRAGVSFGYTAIPNLQACVPSQSDEKRAAKLNYPKYGPGQTWYQHYLSATQRSSGVVVGGWEGTAYWGSGWNSNTGNTDQAADGLGSAGAVGNDNQLFGPTWKYGRTFCLPLKGGAQIEELLNQSKPVIKGFPGRVVDDSKPGDAEAAKAQPGKAILKMKKSYIDVAIDEKSISQNGINISFKAKRLIILVCDIKKGEEIVADAEDDGIDPPPLAGCTLDDDPKAKAIVKIYHDKVDFDVAKDADGIRHLKLPVKYLKKGKYAFAVGAEFNGKVVINGNVAEAKNITKFSSTLFVDVRSSKAVNRNGK